MRLQVNKIEELKGSLVIGVHTNDETYLSKIKEPFRSIVQNVKQAGSQQLSLCDVESGLYAISIFHDENDNGELDTGLFGIPKEPYGFSNNLKKLLPPSFEEATFQFTPTEMVVIDLK